VQHSKLHTRRWPQLASVAQRTRNALSPIFRVWHAADELGALLVHVRHALPSHAEASEATEQAATLRAALASHGGHARLSYAHLVGALEKIVAAREAQHAATSAADAALAAAPADQQALRAAWEAHAHRAGDMARRYAAARLAEVSRSDALLHAAVAGAGADETAVQETLAQERMCASPAVVDEVEAWLARRAAARAAIATYVRTVPMTALRMFWMIRRRLAAKRHEEATKVAYADHELTVALGRIPRSPKSEEYCT
jgi:hypothetical protein